MADPIDMSNPGVIAAIEEARTQERRKLHADIERDRARIRELEEKAAKSGGDDVAAKIAALEAKLTAAEAENARKLRESDERANAAIQAAQKRLNEMEVTAHRATKIAALRSSNTGFIESMVTGATVAEIDASVERAVAEYKKIEEGVTAKLRGAPLAGSPNSGPNGGTGKPDDSGTKAFTDEDIARMTPEQYQHYRASLLTAVGAPTT